ncbi:aspartyl/glutamyl-tRNA(asn/gln) amidotransferase subunit A GatA [Bifidobacterium actinocoloniiforme DSM 22766]|uniref:Glutamyl-tRNA(Gln) amidotransferase subunit A n=1 Tax=Bifidobacterium actinocoloniiforme DSM 22766 TaxID=1437605 RepID=A0A086YVW6_9BIFI|nr:Asp-tRNA(Asn)/Glu-tRNA(Gln) amidotransferase subunit GatA [Bifidobacterium actinocoloniiforme]AKV54935.1 glutamyl-tRNA amidotransferase [Bifidobacterium actinocoloniiforme DSM 22766]KFI38416.1 aspartyl/glutamyl-tRNA(asn/gln) amidotransferase subunit A GatA [Bifidobacterium actinocoloniiforme DSM 22766]
MSAANEELVRLSATQMAAKIRAKEVSSCELVEAELSVIDAAEPSVDAFLEVSRDQALEQADALDKRIAAGDTEGLPELAGVPIAIKDMIVTRGIPTTAASKILEGWVPPYDATVVEKLKAAGMPILGKTNLDEFAQGSSTEHSAFKPTRNPWDTGRVPGGSGGGSASAVGAFEAPLALGTDTGGSIRQPSALTGTVGVKPTYGGVSRYGAIAMASSLDQIGPVSRSVLDAALLQEVIGGYDKRDSTSIPKPVPPLAQAAREGAKMDLKGMKVGLVKELSGDGYQPGVEARFNEGVKLLQDMGAEVVEVSCPHFSYALAAYYIIMPSEVSSNLARYDGMRYGLRVMPGEGVEQTAANMMAATREAGFGDEVKRRIILGIYALSAGYYDAWYGSAQKVRTLIIRDFEQAFQKADVLVSPASPTTAFKFGERMSDPLSMYLSDVATIPANMAGSPAMSIPAGLSDDGLPVGFQFFAPQMRDEVMYKPAAALEAALQAQWGGPIHQSLKTPWLAGE